MAPHAKLGAKCTRSPHHCPPAEIERYKRHLVLKEVGGQGQQKLKARPRTGRGRRRPRLAAGAVPCRGRRRHHRHRRRRPRLARQPAAADRPRHGPTSATRQGAERRASMARRLNPHVTVEPIEARLDAGNAAAIIGALRHRRRRLRQRRDALPRLATPAISPGGPLVFGAVGPFDGYVIDLQAARAGRAGTPFPSYRCLFPEAPPPGTIPNCAEVGVLGAVVGVIGTLQATEVLKEILGIGDEPRRAPADVRRARRAVRDPVDRVRSGKSDQRQQPDDNRPFNPHDKETHLDMRGVRG